MNDSRPIRFADYRLQQLLGVGGFARVYKAWDAALERPVAVKIVDSNFTEDDFAHATAFLDHIGMLISWRHKNIIRIHRVGYDDNYLYLVMEYVDGMDLGKVIEYYALDGELIPHDDVIQVGRSVAKALDYAHRRNVLHLDIKPHNILMGKSGRVLLSDFSVPLKPKQQENTILGTMHYIAPEQIQNNKQVGPLSDLYSLGVVLYEMLTGTVPFDDISPIKVAMQHVNLAPPPPRKINPNLNPATEAVLLKALSKNPNQRYPTGEALINDLEDALAFQLTTPADIRPLPPPPAGIKMSVRRLSQKAMIERVITRMEIFPKITEKDKVSREVLERAINRLQHWHE